MGNIRINKLALELNVQNDQIIAALHERDVMVKNYMSAIDDEMAEHIRALFKNGGKTPAKKTESASKAKKTDTAKKKPATKKAKTDDAHDTEKEDSGAARKTKARAKTVKEAVADSEEAATQKKTAARKSKAKTEPEKPAEAGPPAADKVQAEKPVAVKAGEAKKEPHPAAAEVARKDEDDKSHHKKLGLKIVKHEDALHAKEAPHPVREHKEHKDVRDVKDHGREAPKPVDFPKPHGRHEPHTRHEPPPRPKPAEPYRSVEAKAPPAPAPAEIAPSPLILEEGFEKVQVRDGMTARELAEVLKCTPNDIIRELMSFGIMATINQSLDLQISSKIADKMGFEVEEAKPEADLVLEASEEAEEADPVEDRAPRPPIITIMGHVDHGKTSLLDAIRQTNTTDQEAGGITQHIGAYQVKIKNQMITFLDTPGHEAFTAMRARGAQVTDIVVLVVAADDGIKPQTKEAIDHARAANVSIVVAINKIDKADAKPDEVKKQLADLGLLPEEWGGQTIFTQVSALKKIGIESLLELLLLQAEIMDLKANPKLMPRGVVIESKLDKGRGPVATVLVQKGTLKVGQPFIVGCFFGRVRALINHQGKKISQAGPSTPVEVLGIPDVPQPGDVFLMVRDEKKARVLSTLRMQKQREHQLGKSKRITLEDLHQQIKDGKIKELNVIIKADVQGSIQAVQEAFQKLENSDVRIKVIHGDVGGITESDVLLASASNALIIGFNVRPTEKARDLASRENVDIRMYSVIYDAINDVKKAMDGMLAPTYRESVAGRAEVRNIFSIPKIGVIAGCMVLSGTIERNLSARLIRDSVVVHNGKIGSLRRFKDDVKSVESGFECGMSFEKFQDIKLGDIIEPYRMEEVAR